MIYVVLAASGTILMRCDAWEKDGVARMETWAHDHGYASQRTEITFMGNMVIWCEEKRA